MTDQQAKFGDLLRRYRARAGLTQEALAERAGLAATTIGSLERGVRSLPYVHTRQRLAEVLDLTTAERAAFVEQAPAPPLPPRTNLPAQRTSIIGRDHEAEALRALLLHDDARLLTLTGVGGCGKTSLALHVAAGLLYAFPGGVWLVEFAPVADSVLVPQTVATALGVQEVADVPLVETLRTALHREPALLVLDNCEHLIDACAALAERLLASCPQLRILATSREPLQIAGERQWRVSTLAAPDPDERMALAELTGYPAVQLFLARAQSVAPAFALMKANAEEVAQICARLNGLPLAVELAAARVRVLSVTQILARLDDALQLLSGGSRAAPTRQQSLQAALDWSYALLTPPEQVLFRRLAVFAGSFDLDAAEAVAGSRDPAIGSRGGAAAGQPASASADDPYCRLPANAVSALPIAALDVLTRLVDKSLVLVETGTAAARYRLLEPVRQYARQRLEASAEVAPVGALHAACYLALAEKAVPALHGPAQLVWLERLEAERDNLRAALHWAEACNDAETGLRLVVALMPFWVGRGQLSEGRRWLEALLALPAAAAIAARLRGEALIAAGRLAELQSDLDAAIAPLEAGLALGRALDDGQLIAGALVWLGQVRVQQRALQGVVGMLEESLSLYRAARDEAGIGLALMSLGIAVRVQGDAAHAVALLEDALARFRTLGDVRLIAVTRTMLAVAVFQQGDLDRADALNLEGLAGLKSVGERTLAIMGLLYRAALLSARGQAQRAAWVLGAVAAQAETLGASRPLGDRATQERFVASVRRRLSAAEFETAWAAGRALTLDQVLTEVLAEGATVAAPAPPAPGSATPTPAGTLLEPLTRREAEVAGLLARGLSDRQIAGELAISVRTVGVHVQHLIAKLAVRSRWQAAEWALAQGLGEAPSEQRPRSSAGAAASDLRNLRT